ncbi:hypothetical protein PLICRDRAFT_75228, partial [Plicaturopsis crispa FD-325 SS-3]
NDSEMIREIMEGAPIHWNNLLTTHLYGNLIEFQNAVKYHEDSLMAMDSMQYRAVDVVVHPEDQVSDLRAGNLDAQNAHISPAGAPENSPRTATYAAAYPKDDNNISPNGTPEAKGARPCRYCGSGKHWDDQCNYSLNREKQAQVNMVS